MVVHVFSPSTRDAEAGESLGIQGQLGLQSKFQDLEIPYLKNRKYKWEGKCRSAVEFLPGICQVLYAAGVLENNMQKKQRRT